MRLDGDYPPHINDLDHRGLVSCMMVSGSGLLGLGISIDQFHLDVLTTDGGV